MGPIKYFCSGSDVPMWTSLQWNVGIQTNSLLLIKIHVLIMIIFIFPYDLKASGLSNNLHSLTTTLTNMSHIF